MEPLGQRGIVDTALQRASVPPGHESWQQRDENDEEDGPRSLRQQGDMGFSQAVYPVTLQARRTLIPAFVGVTGHCEPSRNASERENSATNYISVQTGGREIGRTGGHRSRRLARLLDDRECRQDADVCSSEVRCDDHRTNPPGTGTPGANGMDTEREPPAEGNIPGHTPAQVGKNAATAHVAENGHLSR